MNARLWIALRRLIAMLCLALTFVLSAQTATAAVDHAQHAADIDHAPNPIVGQVHFEHDHGPDEAAAAEDAEASVTAPGADPQSHAPAPHHHHGESPFAPTGDFARVGHARIADRAAFMPKHDPALAGIVQGGPERPPRRTLEA